MSNYKKQFKEDFKNSIKFEKKFDMSQLESNQPVKKKKFNPLPIIIPLAAVITLVVPVGIGIYAISHKTRQIVVEKKKTFTGTDHQKYLSNTFGKLNNITYPNNTSFNKSMYHTYNESEMNAYLDFSNKVFQQLDENSNSLFSPVTLYSVLNNLSSVGSLDVQNELDALLGMNVEKRDTFYKEVFKTNYFNFENQGTIQLRNGAFFANGYKYNQTFIKRLTSLYCEAYKMDFLNDNDVELALNWAREAMKYNDITKEFCGIKQDGTDRLLMFSTMYFNSEWRVLFDDADIKDDFTLRNGTKIETTYMKHGYYSNGVYEYDDYYSFKDTYTNFASITYIAPKGSLNIYDVINNNNIFKDNIEKLRKGINGNDVCIELTAPSFSSKRDLDLKPLLIKLGYQKMFDINANAFPDSFDDETVGNVALTTLKQKSIINLDKKGTEIKNITVGGVGEAAPKPIIDDFEICLNKPFAYIIKDLNGIPLFSGIVDNPNVK